MPGYPDPSEITESRGRRCATGRPIVHFEIGGTDVGETAEFYRKLFAWDIGEERLGASA